MRATNPVLVKELRTRMRGRRAFLVAALYVLILSLTLILVFHWQFRIQIGRGGAPYGIRGPYVYLGEEWQNIGRQVFKWLSFFQLGLVCLFTPAFASGAISLEREQKTLSLLRATLLDTRTIIYGKLISNLAFIFLLIFSSIPIASISFFFGGVSPLELVTIYLILLITVFFLGAVAITSSTICARTVSSTTIGFFVMALVACGAAIPEVVGTALRYRLFETGRLSTFSFIAAPSILIVFNVILTIPVYKIVTLIIGKWRGSEPKRSARMAIFGIIFIGVFFFMCTGENLYAVWCWGGFSAILESINPFLAVESVLFRDYYGWRPSWPLYYHYVITIFIYLSLGCLLIYLMIRFFNYFQRRLEGKV